MVAVLALAGVSGTRGGDLLLLLRPPSVLKGLSGAGVESPTLCLCIGYFIVILPTKKDELFF